LKNLAIIVAIVGIGAVGITPLRAQQESSAMQSVTFGVSRSPKLIMNSLAPSNNSSSPARIAKTTTLQNRLASIAEKITVSKKALKSSILANTSAVSSSLVATQPNHSDDQLIPADRTAQVDLRTYLQSHERVHLGESLVVVTITE
jgi:hypothetical protein